MSEDSINLREEDAENLDGPVEVGSGKLHEEELPLPQLIDVVNERFGTDFTEADQLFFDQIIEAAVEE
jgi:type I restriction enzyme, R subunit